MEITKKHWRNGVADSPGNFENVWDNPGKEDIYEKEDQKNPVTGHIVFDINGDDACSGSGCKSDSNYSQNENLLKKR